MEDAPIRPIATALMSQPIVAFFNLLLKMSAEYGCAHSDRFIPNINILYLAYNREESWKVMHVMDHI